MGLMKLFSKKPDQKLQREYERLMKEAMLAQRGGDIVKSSELHAQAEILWKEIEAARPS